MQHNYRSTSSLNFPEVVDFPPDSQIYSSNFWKVGKELRYCEILSPVNVRRKLILEIGVHS